MSPSNEEALFALALAKPAAKRAAWLDAECEGDPALRQRLEALLAAHEQPETLLATKADTACPTIKLDLADAPDEAVGQTLGRYKLLERVGEGGCGAWCMSRSRPSRCGGAWRCRSSSWAWTPSRSWRGSRPAGPEFPER